MRRLLVSFRSSLLLRNILAVAGGTAMGQVIAFAFSPLITRIYSLEAFGLQGLFLSLINMLAPLIALRFPLAIIVAKDSAEVQNLSRLSLSIALVLASVLTLALLLFRGPVSRLLGADALGGMIYFLPLALLCVALQEVMDYRTARLKAFRTVAAVTVIQTFVTNLARVLGGLFAPIAMTLMTVTSLAPGLQAAILARSNRGGFGQVPVSKPRRLLSIAWTYRDFPIYRAPTDAINAAAQSVPVILLATFFSPAAAGHYVLARSVLSVPTNVVGNAIGNVLYARFAEMARDRKPIAPLVLKATLALFLLCPLVIGLSRFAPPAFGFVFGEEWRVSGHYAQWMVLWIVLVIANLAVVRALPVVGAQYLHLIFNLAILVGGIAGLLIGRSLFQTELSSVAGYSVAVAGLYIAQIVAYFYFIHRFDQRVLRQGVLEEKNEA